ncbi:MAG: molybdenum cofactor biosynthesis protein MoaE, partial [Sphingomonadales bacterium]|nr:molybdenum cofactor biosynthesis protein MoaE [Sphingomonadales bacterium]
MTPRIAVQTGDFDPGREIAKLEAAASGAIASFCGTVRGGHGLVALQIERFPGMTEAALNAIAAEAVDRWPLH